MAVTNIPTGKSLKVIANYGAVDGKVVTKTKSWSQIALAATDDKINEISEKLDIIMAPTIEGTYVVNTSQLVSA